MRLVVDHNKCTGLGLCEAVAPDIFEVQDDGTLRVLDENPEAAVRATLEEAILSCPTEALRLEE